MKIREFLTEHLVKLGLKRAYAEHLTDPTSELTLKNVSKLQPKLVSEITIERINPDGIVETYYAMEYPDGTVIDKNTGEVLTWYMQQD